MKPAVLVLFVTALLGLGMSSQAAADDIAVIVNPSNPITALTMIQLRKIVLAQEGKWPGGGKIVMWMTAPGQPERATALKLVCGMTETDFTLHFMHASFNGDSGDPPKTAGSGAQVRQSVAGSANGLGFIGAAQVDDSVKVVTIDGNRPGQPTYKLKVK